MNWWLGIALGVCVMGGHALLRTLTHHLARKRAGSNGFLLVELGGVGVRMGGVLVAVALVLALTPVHKGIFVGTVLFLLVLSMIVEKRLILRRLGAESSGG